MATGDPGSCTHKGATVLTAGHKASGEMHQGDKLLRAPDESAS